MTTPADAESRRIIREELDLTLVVEAAAGTGKTTMLVERILGVLRTGRGRLARIVAVTFTEKAAGEMRLRLRAGLEEARADPGLTTQESQALDQALAELEAARIGTIHSFCADLLHERPIEAAVDPIFDVDSGGEAGAIYERAFQTWFQRTLEDPPEGVRRILRRRPAFNMPGPRELLRTAGWRLIDQRDFDTPWSRVGFDRDDAIDALIEQLQTLGELADAAYDRADYLARNLAAVQRFCLEITSREAVVKARDYDGLEAQLRSLKQRKVGWHWRGRNKFYGEELLRAAVIARRDEVKDTLDRFLADADADLAACLREALLPLIASYEAIKAQAGVLDFLDLLSRTRDLIRDDSRVRRALQERITHVFVDEFQDTDPLQAEILMLLSADDPEQRDWRSARPIPGKLFVVGDPKQSIYRFRRADVALYESTKQHLLAQGARLVHLSCSFRSVPGIQQLVNAAFAPCMTGGPSQASYVALDEARPAVVGRPSVIALPTPRPYSDWGKITQYSIDMSFPDAVGAFVDWMLRESGWTFRDRDEHGRERDARIEARHVCLLFRRFQAFGSDVTRPYVSALEAREVPHVLVGGRSFHGRDEVLALRNALTAIEWPTDELSVFATLRGPLFSLTDDALLAYRHRFRSLHPLRRIDPLDLSESVRSVAEALDVLGTLHAGRNRRPMADTIARLLEATRAHAGLAIWPTGEQALANVQRIMDMARRQESRGATSFRSFVDQLQREAERGEAGDAPIVEEGTDGVRLMTVHGAKGLEFPVVVLCDPGAPLRRKTPSLHVAPEERLWAAPLAGCAPRELTDNGEESLRRDEEEGLRLAYVAATRARDLLVVPVVGDEPQSGWTDILTPAIYPPFDARRAAQPAAGCPTFGLESVLERPARARAHPGSSVAPGTHTPRAGEHSVVWWDPSALALDKEHDGGLRNQRILEPDDDGAADGSRTFAAWALRRGNALEQGRVRSMVAKTVTAVSHVDDGERTDDPSPDVPDVPVVIVAGDRTGRPHGKRFGILVHAVLADADLNANREAVETLAGAHGRLIGASAEEIAAAGDIVIAALAHPLLRRAAEAEVCVREHPVAMPLPDGTILEGVVDLAFLEKEAQPAGAAWSVVDFKTDIDPTRAQPQYANQVQWYVRAIEAATGEPATGFLLMV